MENVTRSDFLMELAWEDHERLRTSGRSRRRGGSALAEASGEILRPSAARGCARGAPRAAAAAAAGNPRARRACRRPGVQAAAGIRPSASRAARRASLRSLLLLRLLERQAVSAPAVTMQGFSMAGALVKLLLLLLQLLLHGCLKLLH